VVSQTWASRTFSANATLPPLPLLAVGDTLLALGAIARFHRRRLPVPLVAVTGSNGKTSTREMIGAILRARGPALKTDGNLNNQVGLPLTLLGLDQTHWAGVVEMGMSRAGEIARLCAIAEPQVGVVTNAGPAHLASFGSLEAVADAKAELYQGLPPGGLAVANADDSRMLKRAQASGRRLVTFAVGRGRPGDVVALEVRAHGTEGMRFLLGVGNRELEVSLPMVGLHNCANAAAAAAAAVALGCNDQELVRGLAEARPVGRRLRIERLPSGVTVLDDCYNANPTSMSAALRTLQSLAQQGGGRALAVLGDMLELGPTEEEAHRALGLVYAGYTESSNSRAVTAQQKVYIADAIRHLERAAGGPSGGSDLVLNYTLGRLYLRDGTPAKAVQSLTRSLNQNPGSVQLRLSLAQAYAGADDLPGAVRTLEEIVDDEPRVAAALAVYQEQSGLFAPAAVTYTKALAVQPMNRELKFRRIAALQSAKDYTRAAAFAADARKQHPEDARFARLQGRALFDGGDRSAGVSVLESAARAFPKDIPTQYDLADIYRDAGRDLDAEKALRQILAAEPGHANALNYLGYLLALRGVQLDEAVQLVRRALDTEPTNGAYLDSLGWVHFRRGEFAEAEKYLNAAAERMPGNSEVYDHLGDVYAKRGRWPDAIAAWTRALAGDREDVDAAMIEKKIADAKSRVRR